MKKKEVSNERLMFEIAQENKKLSEPLTRALKEVHSPLYTTPLYRPLHRPLYRPSYHPLIPALTRALKEVQPPIIPPPTPPPIPPPIHTRSPTVAACTTYGCSLDHLRLQPVPHTFAGGEAAARAGQLPEGQDVAAERQESLARPRDSTARSHLGTRGTY